MFSTFNKTAKIWYIVLAKGINKKQEKRFITPKSAMNLRDVIILYIILTVRFWKASES